jgi:hypothetical protein
VTFFEDANNETKAKLAQDLAANGTITITQDDKEFTLTSLHVSFSE